MSGSRDETDDVEHNHRGIREGALFLAQTKLAFTQEEDHLVFQTFELNKIDKTLVFYNRFSSWCFKTLH